MKPAKDLIMESIKNNIRGKVMGVIYDTIKLRFSDLVYDYVRDVMYGRIHWRMRIGLIDASLDWGIINKCIDDMRKNDKI